MIVAVCSGALLAVFASVAAWKLSTLDGSGALAAILIGTIVYSAGVSWAVLLLLFFGTATGLGRLLRTHEVDTIGGKTGRRDARQVLANGGPAATFAFLHIVDPATQWQLAFAAALAAAAADTWATEIGGTSTALPRSIVTLGRVPAGTSGGVSPRGFAGAFGGAALITTASLLLPVTSVRDLFTIAFAGIGGSLLDSILGATLQEVRWCRTCRRQTEQIVHRRCGDRSDHLSGIPGFDNDVVNALTSLSAALCAVLVHVL